MRDRRVVSADGRVWRVGRRWLGREPTWVGWGFRRRRGKGRRALDMLDFPDVFPALGDLPVAVVVVALLTAVALLSWFVLFPLLILALDLLLLSLLAAAAVAARLVLGHPWSIEAYTESSPAEHHRWGIRGWRASRAAIAEICDRLDAGLPPEPPPAPPA